MTVQIMYHHFIVLSGGEKYKQNVVYQNGWSLLKSYKKFYITSIPPTPPTTLDRYCYYGDVNMTKILSFSFSSSIRFTGISYLLDQLHIDWLWLNYIIGSSQ